MFIIKGAWKNICRNKGRNILVGVIIMVLGAAVTVALAIDATSSKIIKSYEEKNQIQATLSLNNDAVMQGYDSNNEGSSDKAVQDKIEAANKMSVAVLDKYADSDNVKSYFYTAETTLTSDTVKKLGLEVSDGSTANTTSSNDTTSEADKIDIKENKDDENKPSQFNVVGYSEKAAMTEFVDGTYKIDEGKVFEDFDSNECVIPSGLAKKNNIKVGDEIPLYNPNNKAQTYKLKVTGLYSEQKSSNGLIADFGVTMNKIITSASFINKVIAADSSMSFKISPTFSLKSVDSVEPFKQELKEKGMSDSLELTTNVDDVKSITSTISNVKSFAVTFLIITLIIGVIVLFVINLINIRERKYEIGVLRTIGMSKAKVCAQFLCELCIVAFASLIIGAGIGAAASVPVSNSLLQNEINTSKYATEQANANFEGTALEGSAIGGEGIAVINTDDTSNKTHLYDSSHLDKITSIDAVVDFGVLAELLGVGLLLVLISGLSATIAIIRFSPLSILKERS